MSSIVEDVGAMFETATKNVGTVLGLMAGVAVLAFALPYIISLTQTTIGLAKGAGAALPAAPTTTG